jgi:hypothetical protein
MELRFKGYFRVGLISILGFLLGRKRVNNAFSSFYLLKKLSFPRFYLNKIRSRKESLEVFDRVIVSTSFGVDSFYEKVFNKWLEFFQDVFFVRSCGFLEKKYGSERFSLKTILRGRRMLFFLEDLLGVYLNIQKRIGVGLI